MRAVSPSNPLHYDRECASWKQQNRPEVKNPPASRANEAYHKSYVAMLEDDEDNFDKHCATFHALLDTDQITESYIVEYVHEETKVLEASGETETQVLLQQSQCCPNFPTMLPGPRC